MTLRNIISTIVCGAAVVFSSMQLHAEANPAKGLVAKGYSMERSGDFMVVDLNLNVEKLKVGSNRAKLITPRIVNGKRSQNLRSVGLYGRRRYIYYQRNFPKYMISGPEERVYRRSEAPDTLNYHVVLPYMEWMNGASLVLETEEYGCCRAMIAENIDSLERYRKFRFQPEWLYVRPQEKGPKSRALEGRAYVDFPVDQTIIYPTYRRNMMELAKIQASIDSVRYDKDVTITRVFLKGFASPESPYWHNRDLSIGRVIAVKNYIQKMYNFPIGTISTAYEPEDWVGLRKYVSESNLPNKEGIITLIDLEIDPDVKEALIKKTYPQEYQFMLMQYYPALRHTDYRIEYNVRDYTDLKEIRSIFEKTPSKLGLNEMFMLANSYPEGSKEFNDVFETAARMYPTSEVANLNAATASMENGNYEQASRFLAKAGNGADALYCRGVLAALLEDYKGARKLFEEANALGVKQAWGALRLLDAIGKD